MIRYALKCPVGHVFDAWFRDSVAFDTLAAEGRIACAVCGVGTVDKALMAPSVRGEESAGAEGRVEESPASPAPLAEPSLPAERALAALRQYLSENSDYVGRRFADEARRIHLGEADARSIWGEASPDDARALREEGVPVAPLPWLSRRDD